MIAEFDALSAKIYHYDDDKVWSEARKIAAQAVKDAQILIAARCLELGIPNEFAPDLNLHWYGRGQNSVKERRTEFRKAAVSKIAAVEKAALSQIEILSLDAQTGILSQCLESQAAKLFLETMPSIDQLMPSLSMDEVKSLGVVA
ncbi:hypothetical protein GGQ85_001657 [Nitrobacter vulgaris]|uniref:hypothetical protein n=1 Tax=Nitrobacter vulgaris TaxID=29421 RepID=UPI002856E842|nr:hypothetical protein [Nitrobacter vulgaris]MDR6303958.1 hypothetical protein [Nitrobacter vulgaris]